jgi:hypothetical protein
MTANGPGLGSVLGMVASLIKLQLSVSRMWMALLGEHIMLPFESACLYGSFLVDHGMSRLAPRAIYDIRSNTLSWIWAEQKRLIRARTPHTPSARRFTSHTNTLHILHWAELFRCLLDVACALHLSCLLIPCLQADYRAWSLYITSI